MSIGNTWRENGCPILMNEEIERFIWLRNEIYKFCPTGGPLHVQLEDLNIDMFDEKIDWSYKWWFDSVQEWTGEGADVETRKALFEEIVTLANWMPESWIAAALAYAEGYINSATIHEAMGAASVIS